MWSAGTSPSRETGGSGAKVRSFCPIIANRSRDITTQPREQDPLSIISLFQQLLMALRATTGG